MREIDRRTVEVYGFPGVVLMEAAGTRAAEFIMSRLKKMRRILIIAGPGNNGGDGLVMARLLIRAGFEVSLWSTVKSGAYRGDAAVNEKFYLKSGLPVSRLITQADLEMFEEKMQTVDLIVDALLGTGANREITGITAEIIEAINKSGLPVLSVDIPSGVNADTGELLGYSIKADWTVTFASPKLGLMLHPGAVRAGEIFVGDINIPEELFEKEQVELLTPSVIQSYLPDRPVDAHKGSLGKTLIVAGSPGMTGAAILAAESALKGGSGLVYLAAPKSICPILEAKLVEVIVIELPESTPGIISPQAAEIILGSAQKCDALAIGPGLDTGKETAVLLNKIIQLSPLPMVLDAGALEALGSDMKILRAARHLPVITPHPGEMGRLVGISAKQVQGRRLEIALKNASLWNCNIVLKGFNSIITNPEGRAAINPTGNVSLATAGSGDLLTGLITSFIAQGMPSDNAARAGAYLHGLAGDLLPSGRGNSAIDVLARFRDAFKCLKQTNEKLAENPYLTRVKPFTQEQEGIKNA